MLQVFLPHCGRILFSLLLCSFVLLVPVGAVAVEFSSSTLEIKTAKGLSKFDIELAQTDEQRQRGLMFRDRMTKDHGMLFIFDQAGPVTMWMKNTYISLDILFIDDTGKILHIAPSTQPLSLSLIRSGGAAKAVLELNGGTVKKEAIQVGDRILHPLFKKEQK